MFDHPTQTSTITHLLVFCPTYTIKKSCPTTSSTISVPEQPSYIEITHTQPKTHKKYPKTRASTKLSFPLLLAMVLLVQKLGRALKFPSSLEHHRPNSDAPSASLRNFYSKISDFITQNLIKSEPESESLSLKGLGKCFELIDITNSAFAKLAVEIDYPMGRWGGKLTDEYLGYTLNLLDLLNAVNSSVSHLSQAKLSILHGVSSIESSPSSAEKHLRKIARRNPANEFKFERPIAIEERDGSEEERVVLQALILCKKLGILALGFAVSGLCGDAKPYMEIRKYGVKLDDDSLITEVDSRFCKAATGIVEEVEDVNRSIDRVTAAVSCGNHTGPAEELKRTLKALKNSIEIIEKQANNLFSQILSTRRKVVDNIRL